MFGMRSYFLLFYFFATSISQVFAQDIIRPAYWTRYSNELDWGKASVQTELDNRRYISPHTQLQFIGRVSANYKFQEWLTAGLGFAYSNATIRPFGLFVPEFRPHQELQLTHQAGKVEVSHRLRFEQRYSRDSLEQKLISESIIALRGRYRLQGNYHLIKSPKEKGYLGFSANTESFLTHQEGDLSYSEFRLYAAVKQQPFSNVAFELGLMYLHEWNSSRPDIRFYTLRFSVRHYLSWD